MFSEYSKEALGPKRWIDIWVAGHTVSGVDAVRPVAALVAKLEAEYAAAQRATTELLRDATARREAGERVLGGA
jgi:nitronate monooxygenase